MSLRRSAEDSKSVESTAVNESVDRAKLAEREGRWADACAIYEQLVRNPHVHASTRLAVLRWLGRAYMEQGNRGAALDILEAAVAAADILRSTLPVHHATH